MKWKSSPIMFGPTKAILFKTKTLHNLFNEFFVDFFCENLLKCEFFTLFIFSIQVEHEISKKKLMLFVYSVFFNFIKEGQKEWTKKKITNICVIWSSFRIEDREIISFKMKKICCKNTTKISLKNVASFVLNDYCWTLYDQWNHQFKCYF